MLKDLAARDQIKALRKKRRSCRVAAHDATSGSHPGRQPGPGSRELQAVSAGVRVASNVPQERTATRSDVEDAIALVHSTADEFPTRPMQDNADIGVRMDIMLMRELARSFLETNT